MNQIDLKGRQAIVTGGARGIGLAIAGRLLGSGAAHWQLPTLHQSLYRG